LSASIEAETNEPYRWTSPNRAASGGEKGTDVGALQSKYVFDVGRNVQGKYLRARVDFHAEFASRARTNPGRSSQTCASTKPISPAHRAKCNRVLSRFFQLFRLSRQEEVTMRILPVRVGVYVLAMAIPCVAQSAAVETELPHVELSAGVQGMSNASGADVEREMRALGFSSRDAAGHATPFTYAAGLIPGVCAAGRIAVSRHLLIGIVVGATEDETDGSQTSGRVFRSLVALERVNTTGLVVSYRPNRWFKMGAGPALHDRLLYVDGSQQRDVVAEHAGFGWVAEAEAKFTKPRIEPGRAPVFGYASAQYRWVPPLTTDARLVQTTGGGALQWPAAKLRYDHWAFGFGAGLEF
jgi:hypothetical protein